MNDFLFYNSIPLIPDCTDCTAPIAAQQPSPSHKNRVSPGASSARNAGSRDSKRQKATWRDFNERWWCFSFFLFSNLYSLENWHISWKNSGWKMFLSFWNGPFSGDVYIFGGFKVLWRFVFSVKVYLAWFWQIRLASFLRLFLLSFGQKRWEHWEIVLMVTTHSHLAYHPTPNSKWIVRWLGSPT